MKCIHCGAWTAVTATRAQGKYGIKRARRCANECPIFQTYEVIGTVYKSMNAAARLRALHAAEARAVRHKRDIAIRKRIAAGETCRAVADDLGLSKSAVSLIKRCSEKATQRAK